MKPTMLSLALLMLLAIPVRGQDSAPDFHVTDVNRRVAEYPNRFDLSDPIDSYITFQYLKAEGKASRYRSVASYRTRGFFSPPDAPDTQTTKQRRDAIVNTKVRAVIYYRDKVAGIITPYEEPMYLVTYLSMEGDRWLNAGEDLGNDFSDACAVFRKKARNFAGFIDRIDELQTVSTDPNALVEYLKRNGQSPSEFILRALAGHKLVIYGKIHRRKASWDLLKSLLADPRLVDQVGTVFLELSSDAQDALDAFFADTRLDARVLWTIFQDVQIDGWYDRGMYEFLVDLRNLNKRLPPERRIRAVAVDEPRPFRTFKTKDDMDRHFQSTLDRNTQMALTIARAIETTRDKRNALFVVGVGHAFKSKVPGIAADKPGTIAKLSAAAQLTELVPPHQVFTIFQHSPVISNDGTVHGTIRNGVLDSAFALLGDRPVAFALAGSPVAKEPFDGFYEISYASNVGTFETNYDAYVFLGPLRSEPAEYLLYDIVTEQFVDELTRRAKLVGVGLESWFGPGATTKEAIATRLKNKSEATKRWPGLDASMKR